MSKEMPSIDISGIESLRGIKKEQDLVKDRLEKMISMKDKVSEAVYQKVYDEYSEKLDRLCEEAEPLKTKVRGQYGILRGINSGLEEELKNLVLEKEEMELRNTLGEFEENAFGEEMRDWEVRHTSKQAELDEAEEMREMFMSVFDSAEDLEIQPELTTMPVNIPGVTRVMKRADIIAEQTPPAPAAEPVQELEEDDEPELLSTPIDKLAMEDETGLDESVPEILTDSGVEELNNLLPDGMAEEIEEEFADDDDLDDYEVEETEDVEPPPPPIPTNLPPVDSGDMDETLKVEEAIMPPLPNQSEATILMDQSELLQDPDDPEGTMIIANPKIISLNHSSEGQVIVLGMGTTSLGRSPENDIHLMEDRVSRKHSQISFGPGGYAVYDLNSENGTYVNGNRVREHFLADGDIVTIGTHKYLYRDR